VIENVLKDSSFAVVLDDDDAGESADVVAIREVSLQNAKEIDVFFYHCKFTKEKPGARVDDLYVVCGQAQKSIGWLYNTHLPGEHPRPTILVQFGGVSS
jgi:hypothetical protein